MPLQQAAGTTMSCSITPPATHDSVGFEALTMTDVAKMSDLPPLDGSFDIATFDSLSDATEFKLSDVFRAGGGTIQLGLFEGDAGQAILESQAAVGAQTSLLFTLRSGTKYYKLGIIRSYMPSNISLGGIIRADVECEFTDRTVKVAA